LRPSGTAQINGQSFDVLAEGHFIPRGAQIQIHQVEGATIFVRPAKPARKKA